MGLFFRPKFQQFPCRTKSLPERPSSRLKDICSIVIEILLTALQCTPYIKQGFAANLEYSTTSTGTLFDFFCVLRIEQVLSPSQIKILSLPASRSFSFLIREDHVLNLSHSSSLCWTTTRLTWSTWSTPLHCTTRLTWNTWSMISSLEGSIFIYPT